jgi:hypothetical protein
MREGHAPGSWSVPLMYPPAGRANEFAAPNTRSPPAWTGRATGGCHGPSGFRGRRRLLERCRRDPPFGGVWFRTRRCEGRRMPPGRRVREGGLCELQRRIHSLTGRTRADYLFRSATGIIRSWVRMCGDPAARSFDAATSRSGARPDAERRASIRRLFPIPYSLFPIPYSLFPIPYSLAPQDATVARLRDRDAMLAPIVAATICSRSRPA